MKLQLARRRFMNGRHNNAYNHNTFFRFTCKKNSLYVVLSKRRKAKFFFFKVYLLCRRNVDICVHVNKCFLYIVSIFNKDYLKNST